MSRHGCAVLLAIMLGCLGPPPGDAAATVDLPTPVAVPADLPPQVRGSLEQERTALYRTRSALEGDIDSHDQQCGSVPEDDAARIAACRASGQGLQERYSRLAADVEHFRRLVALAGAVRRHFVALDGFEAGRKAFLSEVWTAGLVDAFNEINNMLPLALASLRDPTKTAPAAIVLLETGKLLSWWNRLLFNSLRGCAFTADGLRATCQNLNALAGTVERTRKELEAAEAAVKPQPVRSQ